MNIKVKEIKATKEQREKKAKEKDKLGGNLTMDALFSYVQELEKRLEKLEKKK